MGKMKATKEIISNTKFLLVDIYSLKGAEGSKSGGSRKLFSWCFLTEDNEIYQLPFTSSKNFDPNQSYRWSKVSAYV